MFLLIAPFQNIYHGTIKSGKLKKIKFKKRRALHLDSDFKNYSSGNQPNRDSLLKNEELNNYCAT